MLKRIWSIDTPRKIVEDNEYSREYDFYDPEYISKSSVSTDTPMRLRNEGKYVLGYNVEIADNVDDDVDTFKIEFGTVSMTKPVGMSIDIKGKKSVGKIYLEDTANPDKFIINIISKSSEYYPAYINNLTLYYDDGIKPMKSFTSINDAIQAHISELNSEDPVPYSSDMTTSLSSVIDIYKTALTSNEIKEIGNIPGHYNSLSDVVYILLQVVGKMYMKVKE